MKRALIASIAILASAGAVAQSYPSRPITFVVAFGAGGDSDLSGRNLAQHAPKYLNNASIVVVNRVGASGAIGTQFARNAAPDGYTLLVVSIAHAVNPWLYKLNYDPIKSFAPISIMATGPNVLAVNPSLPAKNVKELVALAKEKPGSIDYASAGVGSFQHLGGELFKLTAGIDVVHVPFKGGGPSMIDVIGGHTKVVFSSLVQTTPHIKTGKLKALGVGSKERSKVLPDVPSVSEAGVPTYEAVNWWGIVAPAGTPQPIIDRLHKALTAAQDSPEVEKQFAAEGAVVVKKSPTEFGAFMVSETKKWEQVVKKGGIKAE